jgi:hypothetical protein
MHISTNGLIGTEATGLEKEFSKISSTLSLNAFPYTIVISAGRPCVKHLFTVCRPITYEMNTGSVFNGSSNIEQRVCHVHHTIVGISV